MTPQQLVDALEAGTLVIPADYREILQAMATQINAGGGGGSGWATTGTTTLTGATVIDTDGNQLEFNGDVVIKNRVSDTEALTISSVADNETSILKANNETGDGNLARLFANTTDTGSYAQIKADFNDGIKNVILDFVATASEGTLIITAPDGISANDAIPAYADNAAALAALGAGKLYYTDVAGEYIVKMSH